MFEAWIMVCVMNQASVCFPAQDTRGPYKTHDECYERTVEMGADIMNSIPNHIPVSWRCVQLGTPT
jgi:hypothetical protein